MLDHQGPKRNSSHQSTESPLICADELARMLQVSTRTLWRLLSSGQLIQPIKLGGSTRWRLEEVRRWIERGCPAPGEGNNDPGFKKAR